MLQNIDSLVEASPDPEAVTKRLDRLYQDVRAVNELQRLPPERLRDLVTIIGISNFLFHFLIRHPEAINTIGNISTPEDQSVADIRDFEGLRLYKYRELLKITWMDISRTIDYEFVLKALSELAEIIVRKAIQLSINQDSYNKLVHSLSVMAMGKLGAGELNYSSDIDLVFISVNPETYNGDYHDLQKLMISAIRKLNSSLEETTEEGFLYRVDMKLRPWGSAGPMVMAIDDTEHYYEASSEPWERFAWLRARCIAGYRQLGDDIKQRMRPFIFMRSLSTDDLGRFIEIKNEMTKVRKRKGFWNVKMGEGGIRDIEFFIQMLQIVNAAKHEPLQTTNTLEVLAGLSETGLIEPDDAQQLHRSYVFLRRLENRLQMIDERQTHDLPDAWELRLRLARSLIPAGKSNDEILGTFERELYINQSIARRFFDRILPGE